MSRPPTLIVAGIVGIIAVPILLVFAIHPSMAPAAPAAIAPPAQLPTQDPQEQARAIVADIAAQDRTIWRKELLAQEYEQTFIALWDGMRARLDDQHALMADQPFTRLRVRGFGAPVRHAWGIDVATSAGPELELDHARWQDLVRRVVGGGDRLHMSEWHHQAFDQAADGSCASRISFRLFLENPGLRRRSVISGTLAVAWSRDLDRLGHHVPGAIDASNLLMISRVGDLPFQEVFHFAPADKGSDPHCTIDPVIATDLAGDGRQDILLPSLNVVLRNSSQPGAIALTPQRLFHWPLSEDSLHEGPYVTAAIAGDFMGDGRRDLMVCGQDLAPHIYQMNAESRYDDHPILATGIPASQFVYPMCITAGDIDRDGRTDAWVGQYRRPYIGGNLPKPYYDANDAPPSFLLLNRGNGHFIDATPGSGLERKRNRRNYSAALVDLDGDSLLDLVTVNDFSGIDMFQGDGAGHFRDVTGTAIDQRVSFGMSLTMADFLNRGLVDLFVGGMGSTTARRLAYMKLGRSDRPRDDAMRAPVAYGNRMLLADGHGAFQQAPFNDTIARTGWSWGSAAIDPDNGGNVSIYVADGNMSRTTAKDYCTRYWTHDIYLGDASASPALNDFFQLQSADIEGMSWNPFEHKALLMNEGGGHFLDVAYLMGLGLEYDGRETLAVDLDGDGATDLVMVEYRMGERPYDLTRPVLHVYRNTLASGNHWLRVRLAESRAHPAMGAVVDVASGDWRNREVIVSGTGYRSQQPMLAHFGLGSRTQVDLVSVRWPDGTLRTIQRPAIDKELVVSPER